MAGVDFADTEVRHMTRTRNRQPHLHRKLPTSFVDTTKTCTAPIERTSETLPDYRFRRLIGAPDWWKLRSEVQSRFSKKLRKGDSVVYAGTIREMRMNALGWCLAQAARLIGAPLPLDRNSVGTAAVVTVTEDPSVAGQFWTRTYCRKNGFPQVIHSSKRFQGPTGLEEYIGYGVGMTLTVRASETGGILFESDRYYVELPTGHRLTLPTWINPGHLVVGHHAIDRKRFAFTLDLTHPVFGELIHQRAEFEGARCPPFRQNTKRSSQ